MKNKIKFLIIGIFIIVSFLYVVNYSYNKYNDTVDFLKQQKLLSIEKKINDIKSHYGEKVIVTRDSELYNKNKEVIGTIYKDNIIYLNEVEIDENTDYFSIKDSSFYIKYDSVIKTEDTINEISRLSKEYRYKNYIVFNKNIVTKDSYSLYYNGNKVYTFDNSDTYPIIINNYEGFYYIEYNDKLYGIDKDDIKEIVDSKNSNKKNAKYVTTLCYHRVNKSNEKCTSKELCRNQSKFDEDLKYMKDNGYLTLTMEEMYMYLKGNIMISKGVTITLDDGKLLNGAQEIFMKYDLNGTVFLVSSRNNNISKINTEYIDIQSHTHKMHSADECPRKNSEIGSSTQGGGILCNSEEYILNDLLKSREVLGPNTYYMAYPFYDYNKKAVELVKKANFRLAFVGIAPDYRGRSYPNKTDLYRVPRWTVWNSDSISDIAKVL